MDIVQVTRMDQLSWTTMCTLYIIHTVYIMVCYTAYELPQGSNYVHQACK